MEIQILANGALSLKADQDDIETIQAHPEWDDVGALCELTESYWTNGGYQPFDAGLGNPFVGLTSAPCIAESMSYDDNGKAEVDGRLWWFPDYALRSPIRELVEKGEVVFASGDPSPQPAPPTRPRPR